MLALNFSVSVNMWKKKRSLLGKGILFLERVQFKVNFKMKECDSEK